MKAFARALMCGLFATTLGLAACDDDGGTKTDTGGADTTPDTGGGDTGGGDTAADTTPDTAPDTAPDTTPADTAADTGPADTAQDTAPGDTTPGGACTNEADLAIITSGDKDPSAKAAECGGTSCIAQAVTGDLDAFEDCVQTCMLNESLPNYEFVVSEACTTCYSASVRCTAEFCGLNDPNKSCVPASFGGKGSDSVDCAECRADNGCTASFYSCSGLTPPPEE